MTSTLSLNSKIAQQIKIQFLCEAAQGDDAALYAWADWLEDNGSQKQSARVRADIRRHAEMGGLTGHGERWLTWYARYQLALIADSLAASETAFASFGYHGNWDWNSPDRGPSRDDGSMEYALRNGYVPTLRRGKARQRRLGRIVEACGWRVFWID